MDRLLHWAILLVLGFAVLPACAQPPAEFYAGKQITLIVGADSGGGYDAQARLMARHLGRFIPGNPTILVQNMPGAGSVVATNYLYNRAAQDGTVLGLMQRGVLTARIAQLPNLRFDIAKLNWIGNLSAETSVVVARADAAVKTTEDLFRRELIVGGSGASADSEATPRLLNFLIGTRFRIISGYPGNADILLALDRGEIEGVADWAWSNVKTRRPDYLRDDKIVLLMQGGLAKAPDLPDVPLALDFAKTDADRAAMRLYFAQKIVARPIMAPPDVPADRVALLRAAFDAMCDDPQFRDDSTRSNLEIQPSSGATVDRIVAMIIAAPPAVAARLAAAINPARP
jgi:tripartite-type tricarboxylate transporter receptor subunit TctC